VLDIRVAKGEDDDTIMTFLSSFSATKIFDWRRYVACIKIAFV